MRRSRKLAWPIAGMLAAFVQVTANADMLPGLSTVSDKRWDMTAVRRVLHTFAYGGQASRWQIWKWSTLDPEAAIVQMLSFDEHNLRLSRVGRWDLAGHETRPGTLAALTDFLASNDPRNKLAQDQRAYFERDDYGAPMRAFMMAARLRGLNPFRQKIGLWETNYHMAANIAAVGPRQLITYFDEIMEAHEEYSSYHEVMNTAALTAAIARQYGHLSNRYYNGECYCNEDFAREYFQLFFGILGEYDPVEHEEVTIKDMAAALSGMRLIQGDAPEPYLGDQLDYRSDGHPDTGLRMLEADNLGANTRERVSALSPLAIEHPESLDALPLMIVMGLADDELSEIEANALKTAWRSMQDKDLLRFLRAYAVSTLFHSANRVKRWSSIDRHLLVANLFADRDNEHMADFTEEWFLFWDEDIRPFNPLHDVFGHQTGMEAAESAEIFRRAYDHSTRRGYRFLRTKVPFAGNRYGVLNKNWRATLKSYRNRYSVASVAKQLWQRFIADGFKYYGALEQANLYALLAEGKDISALAFPDNIDRVLTLAEAKRPPVSNLIAELGRQALTLEARDQRQREKANQRVGQAVNFIIATPFMFAQEGR